ncbi:MAG TPA: 4'-phosphopantetheinyl transferase superfamily protein [Hanamia sp.]
MPLFYQHTINGSTKLAVWHITEEESFFRGKVSIQKEVTHPHKRLQHLAGRYLLEILHPGFPFHLIKITSSKKPLLNNGEIYFSISHCGDYAAAIISGDKLVGIDVELITPKIEMVKTRFLRDDELDIAASQKTGSQTKEHQLLTLFWSSKEAIYKWYGLGALSFKNNMGIKKLFFENDAGVIDAYFKKEKMIDLKIEFRFFQNLCLAWVVG